MTENNIWREWPTNPPSAGFDFEYKGVNYTVIRPLGRGGQAVSILVISEAGDECVFKVFLNVENSAAKKEWIAAKNIKSSRCAKVYDILENDGKPLGLIYEYIEGRTLKEIAQDLSSKLTSEEYQKISIDILLALDEIHQRNIIHRDITPGNVVVLPNNREIRLIDFGLATSLNAETRMGFGTEIYMAPERWTLAPASPAMDIYGFAATVISVITGEFENYLTSAIAGAIGGPWKFLGVELEALDVLDGLGRALVNQLEKGLASDPIDRPRTARDFADLIEQVTDIQEVLGEELENDTVAGLLNVRVGSAGVLAVLDNFALQTKVTTKLEEHLLPRIVAGELDVAFLSGNPGDGKTSFIRQVEMELIQRGGRFLGEEKVTGWTIRVGDHEFGAIFDASESVAGVSSDDRIRNLLRRCNEPNFTALIAVNDGRIDLFLRNFADEFEFAPDIRSQLRGSAPVDDRKLLIDLKRRSLVGISASVGLGQSILVSFTRDDLWTVCSGCKSRMVCPILENSRNLQKASVQEAIEELLTISHLRRERRATFRDVRSVFAYLITGDLTCKEIHSARSEGRDLRRGRNSLVYNLAFSGKSQDHLIKSWNELDPALLPLSGVGRVAAKKRELIDPVTGESQIKSLGRRVFFGLAPQQYEVVPPEEVRMYRHFDEYRSQLFSPTAYTKERILHGISKVVGAIGFDEPGVAISASQQRTDWSVLKVIEETEFELRNVALNDQKYIEFASDKLLLVHIGTQISLQLSLDSFEMLIRAAEGEILADNYSDAVIKEVEGFASQLRAVRSSSVSIIDPIGNAVLATSTNAHIKLERI